MNTSSPRPIHLVPEPPADAAPVTAGTTSPAVPPPARLASGPSSGNELAELAYPTELAKKEYERIHRRRSRGSHTQANHRPKHLVGFGLSGGGIRSATFCLGAFQALAGLRSTGQGWKDAESTSVEGHLRHIDLLSTVSGGGYFGAFFGSLFTKGKSSATSPTAEPRPGRDLAEVEAMLSNPGSPEIRHLREHGRYLAPNGTGDTLLLLAVVFRNWAFTASFVFATLAAVLLMHRGLGAQLDTVIPWDSSATVPAAIKNALAPSFPTVANDVAKVLVTSPSGLLSVGATAGAIVLGFLSFVGWTPPRWRTFLANGMTRCLVVAIAAFALDLATCAGVVLRASLDDVAGALAGVQATALVVVGFGRRLASWLQARRGSRTLPTILVARIGAGFLGASLLVVVSALVDKWFPWNANLAVGPWDGVGLGLLALVVFGPSLWPGFVNRTSHHALYHARLLRAYVRASRSDAVRDVHRASPESDDLALAAYYDVTVHDRGAPLHFINTTLNETLEGESRIQQLDRKGVGLAIGPAGIHLGIRHHRIHGEWTAQRGADVPPSGSYAVFSKDDDASEDLTLGAWTAISGAAVSTGLGVHTTLATSLLLGLLNVRLGVWWKAGTKHRVGALHGALHRLLRGPSLFGAELFARFPGTRAPTWYLSDGGHFENLGGYELLRRRVGDIVLLDAEADPSGAFEALGMLVHKARVDFGTEIAFLDAEKLNARVQAPLRPAFGTLHEFSPSSGAAPGRIQPFAALADLHYPDGSNGRLLYVKARLHGDEPADLGHYAATHPSFPHEPTLDQFFDDLQWESYRKLGEHLMTKLLSGGTGAWDPETAERGWIEAQILR